MSGSGQLQRTAHPSSRPEGVGWFGRAAQAIRVYWGAAVPIFLLSVAAGLIVGSLAPTTYSAEARLAVGRTDLASYQIPGYATAVQELASQYARYLGDVSSDPGLVAALGGAGSIVEVEASPVPDSNVIRIQVRSRSASEAVRASDRAAQFLQARVNATADDASLEDLLREYEDVSRAAASARADNDRIAAELLELGASSAAALARTPEMVQSRAALDVLELRQSDLQSEYLRRSATESSANRLTLIGSATLTGNDSSAKWQLGIIFGALGGYLLAATAALTLVRRARISGRQPLAGGTP